ncbi:hypothetical protein SAMN05443633_10129 [Chryseobacterium arachidis]|uniref:Uncharacterized protein n=1 Tax=Chryseobacterium arachidis TaxID=1416778 RepID=A0A1M4SNK4_9FLAO|nr:hypothetical protein SAMN05443633_10129 [Chryseobacterium arachidis]
MNVTFNKKIITLKQFLTLLIFLLLSGILTAHKPKSKSEKFGNVKTFFKSGFNFGDKTRESQEMKIHIIGKLSETVGKRLNFKDTLMIEYERSYKENKLIILENNNTNYKVLGLTGGSIIESNGKGLAVRIIDENINVIDVLKLVEYSICNRKKINKFLIPTDYIYDYSNENKITVPANSEDFIQKILKKKSDLIDEIIKDEIELLNNGFSHTKISWKNGEFIFGFNNIPPKNGNYLSLKTEKYIVKDFKYYIENFWNDFFVIFQDSSSFTYFDGWEKNTCVQKIEEKVNGFYPFMMNKERITSSKILLIPAMEDFFYVYDIKKKLLQKVE